MVFEMVVKEGWLRRSASDDDGPDHEVQVFDDMSLPSVPSPSPSNFTDLRRLGQVTLQSLYADAEASTIAVFASTTGLRRDTAQAAQPTGPGSGAAYYDTSGHSNYRIRDSRGVVADTIY